MGITSPGLMTRLFMRVHGDRRGVPAQAVIRVLDLAPFLSPSPGSVR